MLIFLFLVSAQIILESFPISSSGHVLLIENFLNSFFHCDYLSVSSDTIVSHFLHGPTALILALFFFDRWTFLLFNIRRCWAIVLKIIFFAFVADLITFPFYIFFKKVINCSFFPIGVGFLISAAALFSLKFSRRKTYNQLTIGKVALIGVAQGISLLPGISRFGLTFVTACCLGIADVDTVALKSLNDSDPADNYIEANHMILAIYNGTELEIQTPDANP